jgi:hypothetical protein
MIGPEDLLNAGEVVEVDGQAWTFSHSTPDIQGKFSAWLKGRARQGLTEERRQGILGPEEYREQSAYLTAEFTAGAYSWGSPLSPDGMGSAVQTALEEVDGKVRLVQLLLERAHGKVPAEQVFTLLRSPDVGAALGVCLDPNRRHPANQPGQKEMILSEAQEKGSRTATPTRF